MNYREEYESQYAKALQYKRRYLKNALEEETKKMVKDLDVPTIDDKTYREDILPFWEKYNRKPDKFWFEYFGARDGIVDAKIIPSDIYYNELVPYINNLQMRHALHDKNLYDMWFHNVRRPKNICHKIAGIYYDSSMNMIEEDEAVKLCLDHEGRVFIKPSIYSHHSMNINVFDPAGSDESELLTIFKMLGGNFVAEEEIIQHKDLSHFNSSSVNTIRIFSLLTQGEVHVMGTMLRVGAEGEDMVSTGSGGWCVALNNDGTLNSKALQSKIEITSGEDTFEKELIEKQNWLDISSKIKEGCKVPSMSKLKRKVKELHPMMPHLKWIGWDFTIDIDGEVVLIEINTAGGIKNQVVSCEPIFRDMTEYILDDYFIHRTMEKNQKQGCIPL